MTPEQIGLDDIEHLLHLTKDQGPVLREGAVGLRYCINQLALPTIDD